MAAEPLITTYLEMRSRDQLRPKRADARFQVREKTERDWRFNRDLYFRVGEQWDWIDKRPWTDDQWKEYAAAAELCTFAGYYDDVLAGYYELRRDTDGGVEIAYFGLLPEFIGRGLGGALLTSAIEEAWRIGTEPITCVGAYVQSRSSAGARELSGARDGRLQGRKRGLGAASFSTWEAVSFPYRMRSYAPQRADVSAGPGRPRAGFAPEIEKISNFLKCPASKSLERNEANQINNRYDEHGSRQPYY